MSSLAYILGFTTDETDTTVALDEGPEAESLAARSASEKFASVDASVALDEVSFEGPEVESFAIRTVGDKRASAIASCVCCTGLRRLVCGSPSDDRGSRRRQINSNMDAQVDARIARSSAVLRRHLEEDISSGSPALHVYEVSADPPTRNPDSDPPRRAIRLNAGAGKSARVDNNDFVGEAFIMHRTCAESTFPSPCEWYFEKKTRRWEIRVQGCFKRKPTGKFFVGAVLQDFDYSEPETWSATVAVNGVKPFLDACVGESFIYSWGSRGEAASSSSADLFSFVAGIACIDQVIMTPAGERPPSIAGDIADFGIRRNAMPLEEYRTAATAILDEITTEAVYTFCLWGPSQLLDIRQSQYEILGSTWSYASLIDQWPIHIAMYFLEEDAEEPRHLECRKSYFFDAMFWSSNISVPLLPYRYSFTDEQ